MEDIRNLTEKEINEFVEKTGEKKFRAKQLTKWLWQKGIEDFDEISNLPQKLIEKLKANFTINNLTIDQKSVSKDGTIKLALKLHDNLLIESVLIPSKNRTTVCVSTQVGCALACAFCATGKMRLKKNLTAGEIYFQVFIVNKLSEEIYGHRINNIVIMGMGEPLANYRNLELSLKMITSDKGLGISPKRITISTVGLADKIKELADNNISKYNLAVSLHTANEEKRSSLMPVNRKYNLKKLSEAIKYYHTKTGKRITYEYLLIGKFNDGRKDAKELADFCKISPCKINLIEYNPTGENDKFSKSTEKATKEFIAFLESKNLLVQLRRSKGQDIKAACGQLATDRNKKRLIQ